MVGDNSGGTVHGVGLGVGSAVAVTPGSGDAVGSSAAAGVAALKIEGRQRGRAYVSRVVGEMRKALGDGHGRAPRAIEHDLLDRLSEGQRTTTGAFEKRWR